jgi:Tol biopolymer transport system component
VNRRLAVISLFCAALCGLVVAVSATSRDIPFGYSIVVINADGSKRHAITPGTPAQLVLRALSPDGRTLAYQRRRVEGGSDLWSIEVMPAGGGAARTLVSFPGASAYAPTWSRDGKLVAFEMCCNPRGTGVVRADGSRFSTIPDAFEPAWLPDGQLAFLTGGDLRTEIATANPDGSERKRVLYARPFEEFARLVASPNGQTLAFTSYREAGTWLDLVGLTGIPLSQIAEDASEYSWSPTGRRLVFVTRRGLVTVRSDGSKRRRYAATRILSPAAPAWSPDATRIAFVANGYRLVVMNVRRGSVRVVARGVLGEQPLWSRDGRRLYYVVARGI